MGLSVGLLHTFLGSFLTRAHGTPFVRSNVAGINQLISKQEVTARSMTATFGDNDCPLSCLLSSWFELENTNIYMPILLYFVRPISMSCIMCIRHALPSPFANWRASSGRSPLIFFLGTLSPLHAVYITYNTRIYMCLSLILEHMQEFHRIMASVRLNTGHLRTIAYTNQHI
jgi:hypothetical protein